VSPAWPTPDPAVPAGLVPGAAEPQAPTAIALAKKTVASEKRRPLMLARDRQFPAPGGSIIGAAPVGSRPRFARGGPASST